MSDKMVTQSLHMISATSLIGWTGIVCSASADAKVSFSSVSVPPAASELYLPCYSRSKWRNRDVGGIRPSEGRKPASQSPELPVPPPHCVLELAAILLQVCVKFP